MKNDVKFKADHKEYKNIDITMIEPSSGIYANNLELY